MKDAYWFRHDSNARNDEKIIDLRSDLGYEGYGIYWALIEFLRDNDNYEAEYKPKRLAMALQVDESLIQQVINGYNLFYIDHNGKFYSNSLKFRMKEMDKKREQQRQKAKKRWNSSENMDKESNDESHSNTTAFPDYSHKNKKEKSKEEKKRTEKNIAHERVQGENGYNAFFSECLLVRNIQPVILFFEYLHFTTTIKTNSVHETRLEFLKYWKESSFEKNDMDVKKRIITMAKLGFELSDLEVNNQYKKFLENQTQEKPESEYYLDFLNQLKKEGFNPIHKVKAMASDYLKF